MKQEYQAKITLSAEELKEILRTHLGLDSAARVEFKVADTSDDRFRGGPSYSLVSVTVDTVISGNVFNKMVK
jgi:hypothetical protein